MLGQKFDLGFFPTPLQPLKNLSLKYEGFDLWIKRDDNTGLASGGNKTRKLEYLIRQALDEGCDPVVTAGAQQSNHCRQTAAACAVAGLGCHLMLGGHEPGSYNGNLLLSALLGAEITFTGDSRKGEEMDQVASRLEMQGMKPYLIPYGGSNGTGALGFVDAARELKTQLEESGQHIDYIYFASSSGGMQAGLTLGVELFQLPAVLKPVRIDKSETNGLPLSEMVYQIVTSAARPLGVRKQFSRADTRLDESYDSAGYGVVTDGERRAIRELAQSEGILLDPVYTGRAFYGMLDSLDQEKIPRGSSVLFWHTGGLPALFDYSGALRSSTKQP